MDQGNDAVHVREILERKQILLRGPETGVKGVYHGSLWYYFISIGFVVFNGHPVGSVFMLVILNIALLAITMYKIKERVSYETALVVGAGLLVFWRFYDVSRYGFNPFPLVFLSIILIFFLIDFLEGKRNYFVFAAIPVGFAYHCEAAAAVAFTIFYLLFGIWAIIKKRLDLKTLFIALSVLAVFFIPRIISEIQTDFSQSKVLRREFTEPAGIFSETKYQFVFKKFKEIINSRILPQVNEVGLPFLAVTLLLFLTRPKKNQFTKRFTYLSLILVVISWIWFGSNKGWQTWHTIYISPLIYTSILLMLLSIRKFLAYVILAIILLLQLYHFKTEYLQNYRQSNDPSILKNELGAIDWIYKNSDSKGFYVYSYLPSVYDYPYQYLFWWFGRKNYGYVPCEYSTFPNSPSIFVPGYKYYQDPKRECSDFRFLIVEPDKNQLLRDRWLEQVRRNSELLDSTTIGDIKIEKRKI